MNTTLYAAAKEMINRCGITTRVATEREIHETKSNLGDIIPPWLTSLILNMPICSSTLIVPVEAEVEEQFNLQI
ncbi:hypothetical protein [Bacillus sp. T33-2]|uniref:hypothetical protein n=1 Tax=Bacillus sp. T33-2 TaxID=2054168 RepID=UPI000C7952BC|nr:hypothetical protein [Bacillus sp. T33-2]PLR95103.1 hypothetical protein CVD19_15730 [Bacillus sp. T33-2]